jgi:hypothetical protein
VRQRERRYLQARYLSLNTVVGIAHQAHDLIGLQSGTAPSSSMG